MPWAGRWGCCVALALVGAAAASPPLPRAIDPAHLVAIATVEERFQSYNVEMAEVAGTEFWKPYPPPRPLTATDRNLFVPTNPIALANPRLRTLAAALGPAFLRVSGTWANRVFFNDSDTPRLAPPGFQGVLTRAEWRGVIDFARAVDAKLVTSFAVSAGVRDAKGIWKPDQARRLLRFTRDAGGEIAAAEFMNEPNLPQDGAPPGYTSVDYARDFAIFRTFARKAALGLAIVGPGTVGEGAGRTGSLLAPVDLLAALPHSPFDIFSYHSYAAVSERCAGVMGGGVPQSAALSESWLARTEQIFQFYSTLRDRFAPEKPIWVTETAEAACGGDRWAKTFLDTFRYLNQLGVLARHGVKAVFHNTLGASDYGLLDSRTLQPRPNYWAAVLWRRLMGTVVLDAGPIHPGLHLFAQCLRGQPGGVTVLALNLDKQQTQSLAISETGTRYTLTAPTLDADQVLLNGRQLVLAGDRLPPMTGKAAPPGVLNLPPASITFVTFPQARNASCAAKRSVDNP